MNNLIIISAGAGLLLGCLINYLADVLPITRKFSAPVCPHCSHTYSLKEYLLFLPCSQCQKRRSIRAWLTLAGLTALSVWMQQNAPARLGYPLTLLVVAYFALILIIDLEHRLILHPTSWFGAALGLLAGWKMRGLEDTLLGGLLGFGIMFALYQLGRLFARYRARRMAENNQADDDEEALGFGDVNLSGALGLMLGWRFIWLALLQAILLAGIAGVIIIAVMLVVQRYKENALMIFMPYAPFLLISAFLFLFTPHWTLGAILASMAK